MFIGDKTYWFKPPNKSPPKLSSLQTFQLNIKTFEMMYNTRMIYLRYFWLNLSQGKSKENEIIIRTVLEKSLRDVVSFPLLLPVRLRSLRFVVDPHLPPQVVSANSPLLEIFDDSFPGLLPVRKCTFPLTSPGFIFGFDHHNSSLCFTQLSETRN